jgi:hypothetical protein
MSLERKWIKLRLLTRKDWKSWKEPTSQMYRWE